MALSILAKLGMDSSEFKAGLTDASRQTSSFGKKLTSAITTATKIAGAALAGLAIKGTKDMIDFQKGISEVFTLMPGISKAAMGEMEKDVRSLAQSMGVNLNDAVRALYQAISAGVDPNNAIDFLRTSSKTAIAGVASLEDSVGALTTIINGYGMSAKEATKVSDVLFSVVKNGVTNMTELGQNIGKVTPIAASLGVAIEEVGAMFAVLTKQMGAGKTAEAGTAIRSMLAELSKEGMKANENFMALGKGGFAEFIKNGGKVGEALMMLKESAETSGKTLVDMFSGIEAGNGALMLVTQGGKELSKQLQNIRGDAGATETAFATMEQTVSRQFDKLLANLKEMGMKIGEAFLPVLNDLIPRMSEGMKDFAPRVAEIGRSFASVTTTLLDMAPVIGKVVVAMAAYTLGAKASAVATNLLGKNVRSLAPHLLTLWGAFEAGKALGNGLAHTWKRVSGELEKEVDLENLKKLNDEFTNVADRVLTLDEKILSLRKSLGLIKEEKPFEEIEKLNLTEQVDALREMGNQLERQKAGSEKFAEMKRKELAKEIEILKTLHEQKAASAEISKQATKIVEIREQVKKIELGRLRTMTEMRELSEKIAKAERDRAKEEKQAQDASLEANRKEMEMIRKAQTFQEDLAKAVDETRKNFALSATEAGKIVILGRQIRDLELAKQALIEKTIKAQAVQVADAAALRNIEADLLNKRQQVLDLIKNKLKQARGDELQALRNIVAELEKALDAEKDRAKEAKANAEAKEKEVKALRENLKEAQGELEKFKKFFDKDIRGKLKINVRELHKEFKELKQAGKLPDNVKTLHDFEAMVRAQASAAKIRRDEILENGRQALADAKQLREEEKHALEEQKRIEQEIKEKREETLALEKKFEEGRKRTLEEMRNERLELEKTLQEFQDVNVLPEFDASIVEAIRNQADNLKALDHNVAALAGRGGALKVDMDLDDSDITKEGTQLEILSTLQGYFVNQ